MSAWAIETSVVKCARSLAIAPDFPRPVGFCSSGGGEIPPFPASSGCAGVPTADAISQAYDAPKSYVRGCQLSRGIEVLLVRRLS